MALNNDQFNKLVDSSIEAVRKDTIGNGDGISGAFPLIINKSFDCLDMEKILSTNDKATLDEGLKEISELKEVLLKEVVGKVNEILEQYK